MTFSNTLARFLRDEAGAVTIDWIVLTSACLGLGMAVLAAMSDATGPTDGNLSDRGERPGATSGSGTAPERTTASGDG